jgi:hypothetical protein
MQHQQEDHTQEGATGRSSKSALHNINQHNSTTIHYNDGALEVIGDACLDSKIKHTIDVNIQIM